MLSKLIISASLSLNYFYCINYWIDLIEYNEGIYSPELVQ